MLKTPSISGPGAVAELNLITNGVDYYDVSIIAGINVPVAITPQVINKVSGDPYTSGNPGEYY